MEHCDWVCWTLTGGGDPRTAPRSRCAAGHKAMWHGSWDGLPSQEFLSKLDPLLDDIRATLYTVTVTSDIPAGGLCPEWAARFGLASGIPVAVGAFDAHMGAVGAGIVPYALTKVIGTSTCDMLVAPHEDVGGKAVRGICGQVDGSVVPGMVGMEAGQSAFGDVYAWWRQMLVWPLEAVLPKLDGLSAEQKTELSAQIRAGIYDELTSRAQALAPDDTTVLAVDWLNGRRTPDADQRLKGALTGLSLGSDPPRVFRALVESTAYGARRIAERFEQEGVPIQQVIALGGVATQSPYVMQTVADVMNRPISIAASAQACALGAAMFGATAAGLYPDVLSAQTAMGAGFSAIYKPRAEYVAVYERLYQSYLRLGGFVERDRQG
jgi:L-ribulokinase